MCLALAKVGPCRSIHSNASCRRLAAGYSPLALWRPRNPLRVLQGLHGSPACEPKLAAQRSMPIDQPLRASVDSSGEAGILMLSYEADQIFSRPVLTDSSGWCRKVVYEGLRPNWLPSPSRPVIANRRWRFATAHGACEFSCVAVIHIGSGHVGPH